MDGMNMEDFLSDCNLNEMEFLIKQHYSKKINMDNQS